MDSTWVTVFSGRQGTAAAAIFSLVSWACIDSLSLPQFAHEPCEHSESGGHRSIRMWRTSAHLRLGCDQFRGVGFWGHGKVDLSHGSGSRNIQHPDEMTGLTRRPRRFQSRSRRPDIFAGKTDLRQNPSSKKDISGLPASGPANRPLHLDRNSRMVVETEIRFVMFFSLFDIL